MTYIASTNASDSKLLFQTGLVTYRATENGSQIFAQTLENEQNGENKQQQEVVSMDGHYTHTDNPFTRFAERQKNLTELGSETEAKSDIGDPQSAETTLTEALAADMQGTADNTSIIEHLQQGIAQSIAAADTSEGNQGLDQSLRESEQMTNPEESISGVRTDAVSDDLGLGLAKSGIEKSDVDPESVGTQAFLNALDTFLAFASVGEKYSLHSQQAELEGLRGEASIYG